MNGITALCVIDNGQDIFLRPPGANICLGESPIIDFYSWSFSVFISNLHACSAEEYCSLLADFAFQGQTITKS